MSYNLKELNDRIALVKKVLRLVENGVTHQDIIKRVGLDSKDNSIITRICKENGVSSRQLRTKRCAVKKEKQRKLREEKREEKRRAKILVMTNMYIAGHTTAEIAYSFECTYQHICLLFRKEYGENWKEILKSKIKPRIKEC